MHAYAYIVLRSLGWPLPLKPLTLPAVMVRHTAAKLVPPSFRGAAKKGSDKDSKGKKEDLSSMASSSTSPYQEPAAVGALALGGGKGKPMLSYRPSKGPKASGEGGLKMNIPVPKVLPSSASASSALEVCGVALISYRPEKPESEVKGDASK